MLSGRTLMFAAVAALLPGTGQPALAQAIVLSSASCADCCIVPRFEFTAGDAANPIPGSARSLERTATGAILATFNGADQPPLLLHRSGAVEAVGREGSGPGEYRRHLLVARGPADSLIVVDPHNVRASVLTPEGRYARAFRLTPHVANDVSLIGDSILAISANIQTPDLAGRRVHLFTISGRELGALGSERERIDDLTQGQIRLIAGTQDERVWMITPNSYTIEEWTVTGTRRRIFRRSADWFQPHSQNIAVSADGEPLNIVAGMDIIGDTLITAVLVPDVDWRAHREERRVGNRTASVSTDFDETYDTVFEWIDLRSGSVIASHRVEPMVPFVTGRYVATAAIQQDSEPTISIWSLRLDRQCEEEQ